MGKIFFKPHERSGNIVVFTNQVAHYLINVLRLRVGDAVLLCDGMCTDYASSVLSIKSKPLSISFSLGGSSASLSELPIKINLYQGIPKGDKLDWITEKCIELGIYSITPVLTERSVVKLQDAQKRVERLSRIAESAASQCMRGILPIINAPQSFSDVLKNENDDLLLVAYENEKETNLKFLLSPVNPRNISLWVGPEGGFADNEITMLKDNNAATFNLGARILRTETAAMVVLAQIQCIWDF